MPVLLNIIIAAFSAAILWLAFPPVSLYLLAFVALMPFFYVIYRAPDYRLTFWYSLIFGAVFYFLLLWVPLQELSRWAPAWLIAVLILLLVLYEALFIAAAALLGKFLQRNPVFSGFAGLIWTMCGYAFAWTLLDWARSLGVSRFTLGGLAYSQYLFTAFIQLARYIGPYGLTFVLVFLNILGGVVLARIWRARPEERWNWQIMTLLLLALGCFSLYGTQLSLERPDTAAYERRQVTVFQPNVPQEIKLDYGNLPELKKYYADSLRGYAQERQTELLVMPETIVPEFLLNNKEFMFALRDALDFSLIFGVPRRPELPAADPSVMYNAAVLYNRYGNVTLLHDKKYLVPFGEYLPLRWLLYPLAASSGYFDSVYQPGRKSEAVAGYALAICFESLFPYQAREQIRSGGRLYVVITNDAWFGRTALLDGHLAAAVLRAVENSRFVLQSANTGRSAIIDHRGRILKLSGMETKEFLEAEIELRTDKTVYTYFGELIIYLAWVFFFLYLYLLLYARAHKA
ncbi:MAG: apolipoprotein N-acyltransferase [Candidatus Margulisbacteria bacterium]|jgi:apolipoprotein N-acyltransferase|nr:apolipoprotein N-acyltransferase [Candidatus Margulisiibacteriota bacterium]